MTPKHLSERMVAAARELQDQHDPAATVQSAVDLAVQHVHGCHAASVSIVRAKQKVETSAASDSMAVVGDQLQYEIGEGPCLSAIWDQEVVYAPDHRNEDRWLNWGPRVAESTGALSSLALRLFTTQDTLGALNLYSKQPDGFDEPAQAEAIAIAAHIAIAVAAAQKIEQFEAALDSRTIIAQACGLVMERFDIDSVRAFALLTRLSSTQNIKLRDVACQVVSSRSVRIAGSSDEDY